MAFRRLGRWFEPVGWWNFLTNVIICIYYGNGRRKPAEGTREEVNKLQRQYHEHPDLFKSDLITPAPGTKIKREPKPYNPIELE